MPRLQFLVSLEVASDKKHVHEQLEQSIGQAIVLTLREYPKGRVEQTAHWAKVLDITSVPDVTKSIRSLTELLESRPVIM